MTDKELRMKRGADPKCTGCTNNPQGRFILLCRKLLQCSTLWDRSGAWYSSDDCVRHERCRPRSGFDCCLPTKSLHVPSETCASARLPVTPNVSPPHYLSGRQQVFCDWEIRESWKDGAAPELNCLCRRRENLCFHFQSLSSRLSHPQITAAPVQYMLYVHVCCLQTGGCLHAPVGSAGGAQLPARSVCTFVLFVVGILLRLWSNDFGKWKTSWI